MNMDLPVSDQAGRPRLAHGTADWETIFESPESGLVPLVSRARSIDGLKACATLVINQLFTRKNDASERERLNDMLARIIARAEADGQIDAARDGVVQLLRSIKQERLLKAAAYVAEKQRGVRAGKSERRRKGGAFLGDVQHLLGARGPLIAAAVALSVCVVGLIGITLFDSQPGGETPDAAQAQSAEGTDTATAKTNTVEKAAPPRPAAPAVTASPAPPESPAASESPAPPAPIEAKKPPPPEYPKTVYFKPMYWAVGRSKVQRSYTYYQAAITVADKHGYSVVCTRQPSVNDILNLALSRVHPATGKADEGELARAGEWALGRIGKKVGTDVITRIDFLRDGNPLFRPNAAPCR